MNMYAIRPCFAVFTSGHSQRAACTAVVSRDMSRSRDSIFQSLGLEGLKPRSRLGLGTGASPAGGHRGHCPPNFIFAPPPSQFISCPPTVFFLKSEHRPHS